MSGSDPDDGGKATDRPAPAPVEPPAPVVRRRGFPAGLVSVPADVDAIGREAILELFGESPGTHPGL